MFTFNINSAHSFNKILVFIILTSTSIGCGGKCCHIHPKSSIAKTDHDPSSEQKTLQKEHISNKNSLEEENNKLKQEHEKLLLSVDALTSIKENLEEENNKSLEERKHLQKEHQKLLLRVEELTSNKIDLEEENNKLEKKRSDLIEYNQSLQIQNKLQEEHQQLLANVKGLTSIKENLEEKVKTSLENIYKHLRKKKDIDKAEKTIGSLIKKIDSSITNTDEVTQRSKQQIELIQEFTEEFSSNLNNYEHK